MTAISRRQLFAMGAAAAVAPVLPAVATPVPLQTGTTLTIRLPSNYEVRSGIRNGDLVTFSGDPRTFTVTGASSGK